MVARFRHVALELDTIAGIVFEERPLAVRIKITRQEDSRPLVVNSQQQAVAVRILAGRRAVVVERRLTVDLRLEGGKNSKSYAAIAAIKPGNIYIHMAQPTDRRCGAVNGLDFRHTSS